VQGFQIRRRSGRQRVERHILAAVDPARIAGDPHEHLEAVHVFDHAAGLEALARIDVSLAGILIGAESAAGNLAPLGHDFVVVAIRRAQKLVVFDLLPVLGPGRGSLAKFTLCRLATCVVQSAV